MCLYIDFFFSHCAFYPYKTMKIRVVFSFGVCPFRHSLKTAGCILTKLCMSRAHSPTFPSLHLRHNSLSNPSVALPTSQLILQPFRHFTYVTTHYPTLPSLYLRHSSFSNISVTSPTSQLILQPFRRLNYVTAHSPTLPLRHLRHSSLSNPSFASPTSQALHLIHLQAAHVLYYHVFNVFYMSYIRLICLIF